MSRRKIGILLEYRLSVNQKSGIMELYVIQSDEFLENHYFVVDEKNLKLKTDNPKFQRLQEDEELNTLQAYNKGGDENFEIIRGKPYDFFVALIRKTFL